MEIRGIHSISIQVWGSTSYQHETQDQNDYYKLTHFLFLSLSFNQVGFDIQFVGRQASVGLGVADIFAGIVDHFCTLM